MYSSQCIWSKHFDNNWVGEILFVGALFIRFLRSFLFYQIEVTTAVVQRCFTKNFSLAKKKKMKTVFHHEMVKIGSQMELQMFGMSSRNSLSVSWIQKCKTKYASGVVHQKRIWATSSTVFRRHKATKLFVKARKTIEFRVKQKQNSARENIKWNVAFSRHSLFMSLQS